MAMFEGIIPSGLNPSGYAIMFVKAKNFDEAGADCVRKVALNTYGRNTVVRGCSAGPMVESKVPYTAWIGFFGPNGMEGRTITVTVCKKS